MSEHAVCRMMRQLYHTHAHHMTHDRTTTPHALLSWQARVLADLQQLEEGRARWPHIKPVVVFWFNEDMRTTASSGD